MGEREIELLLGLRQRVRVGGGRPPADLVRDTEVRGQRVDLHFVEVRDRLHVRRAIPLLHEESERVLLQVWRACDGVVEPVGVMVFEHLPGPLFEIGSRHQRPKGRRVHPRGLPLTAR